MRSGKEDPKRTLTFLWGLEIRSTDRFIKQDAERAKGILFGMSLDMVGEDTKKTGGTFLIEKMPDPSAIWTRGDDHHTEWGGSVLTEDQMTPHFYNDFVIGLIGKDLFPLSAVVQAMRRTQQTSIYLDRLGPFFVGRRVSPCVRG